MLQCDVVRAYHWSTIHFASHVTDKGVVGTEEWTREGREVRYRDMFPSAHIAQNFLAFVFR